MSKTAFGNLSSISDGDVLIDSYGYGVKVLSSIYIESVYERMYVVQNGRTASNRFIPDGSGKNLMLKTLTALTKENAYKWTPDKAKKGDAFKDSDGNYYVAESSDKAWSLSQGTWSSLTENLDGTYTWSKGYSDTVLTEVKSANGGSFSKHLG